MRSVIFVLVFTAFQCSTAFGQTPGATPLDANAEKRRADTLQQRLFNYANYARYSEANAALAPPAKGEARVVFMGDSITDGWKLAEYFPQKPYINRGISGQTTSQMLLRFRPDVIDLKPKAVVILAGTNDIAGNTGPISTDAIVANLTSMADLARAYGIAVIFASIMPVSDHNKDQRGDPIVQTRRRPPERILALNALIRKLCADRKLVYLDYFSAMTDEGGLLKETLAYDGLHPNSAGYQLMKPLAEKAIASALRTR